MSAFETLPDGSKHPLLMQKSFKECGDSADATFAPGASNGYWPANLGFTRPE